MTESQASSTAEEAKTAVPEPPGASEAPAQVGAAGQQLPPLATKPRRVQTFRQLDYARTFFEPTLDGLDLSVAKLEQQNLSELRQSLDRVNEAIAHPESFGTARISMSWDFWVIKSSDDSHITVGILPLLLERKRFILEKMRSLEANVKVENLTDLIEKHVEDDKTRREMTVKLREMETLSKKYDEQGRDVDLQQQNLLIAKEKHAIEMEGIDRRRRFYLTFLERESAATVVGAIILVAVTLALIIYLFVSKDALQVLGNGFLVILGYFFGQSSASKRQAEANQPAVPPTHP